IFGTRVEPRVFSPACDCTTDHSNIDFRLRKRERLTVWVERDGEKVATLVPGRTYPPGKVGLVFRGVTENGLTLPDGVYEPVVHLGLSHRTITLPNQIRIDTKPPVITVKHPQHAVISPDGDGRADAFRTRYRVSEPAHAILLVNERRVLYTYRKPLAGVLVWNGKLGPHAARPRNY